LKGKAHDVVVPIKVVTATNQVSQATLNYYSYRNLFDAMWGMKKLIKKVAERRVEKKRQLAALEAINPPFDTSYQRLRLMRRLRYIGNTCGMVSNDINLA